MKVVAVTACPTGIAHTYMAADALKKAALRHDVHIKVETQGAMGIEDRLSSINIAQSDLVFIVSELEIENSERFEGLKVIHLTIEDILLNVDKIFLKHCRK
ncbi:fructose PTS transporter subunit IIB [Vibrio hannami]|uniref:PTS fructose transporter subunit IIB n=1 Tax=Vibrio hannami TaxID=2717094 RepID=UPI00240EB314|nr:fructose PTS transporter subunit IIB [Vibrio hannami]MDG3085334.1 fructose PTS transporter subunit IIB [Vibrio hannami]